MARPDTGLILEAGPTGRCDDFRIGGAIVDHDAGLWRMWYYCRDRNFEGPPTLGTGRIAHATSTDGIHWQRFGGPGALGSVFEPSPDPAAFDSLHIGLTDITRDAGGWRMWYFGGDATPRDTIALGAVPGLGMRPGLARSSDGIHWHREGDALLDLPPDHMYRAWPNSVRVGAGELLYVTEATLDLARFDTSVWRSTGRGPWTAEGPLRWADGTRAYDIGGMVTRQVLANPLPGGRRYLMIYTGTDAQHRRAIAAAESDDGLVWHRLYDEPIFTVGEGDAWDSLGVAATRLVVANGVLFFYYYGFQSLGNDAGRRGIGLATAPLGDLRQLRRWDGDATSP